jgi:hypothetical protein
MKLNGTHKFKTSSTQVFNGILNPEILKTSIPGCESIEFLDQTHIKVNITTSIPGLRGPYALIINIARIQAPNYIELQVQRTGRGGSLNAISQINIADEPDGALVAYDATAEMEGAVALANNPIGKNAAKSTLDTFFKNLDKAIA